MRRVIVLILLALATLFATEDGLAYKKIKCFMIQPPEQLLAGVKRVAVLDFDGPKGRDVTDYIVGALIEKDRGIRTIEGGLFSSSREGRTHQEWACSQVFDVVERSQLDKVLNEQKFGTTGLMDDSQAAQIGQVLGVDVIISGSVSSTHQDIPGKEQRTVYRKQEEGGNYTVVVDVLTRKVTGTIKMRIVSAETGQILGSKMASREYNKKVDQSDVAKLLSPEDAYWECLNSGAWEIVNYFCPHFDLVELELDKIKAKEFKDKAEDAAKLAERGDLDRAYPMFYALYQADAYNPSILYNLGVLNEVVGNFAEAKEMYEAALSLKSSEKGYQQGAARAQKALAYTNALNSIGVTVTAHEWNTSEEALAAASAEKVTVKGSSGDRQEVYQGPDETSAVVTRVPGGIELEVIAIEGDWYKVKLLGGKEGYIHKKKVK